MLILLQISRKKATQMYKKSVFKFMKALFVIFMYFFSVALKHYPLLSQQLYYSFA